MCVKHLSKVALDSAAPEMEPAISCRKSNALTTTPPSHSAMGTLIAAHCKYAFTPLFLLLLLLVSDVAVGAFISDAVLILRTRPIHSVSARIDFGREVIEWQRANCPDVISERMSAADNGDHAFCLQLTVVFNYSSPAEDPSQHGDQHCSFLSSSSSASASSSLSLRS